MPKPINLTLDWDGTITVKDTMLAYGKIADIRDARLGKEPAGTKMFEQFGKAWLEDYTAHEQSYVPRAMDRKRAEDERSWLNSLETVEARSAERVQQSGFFANVKKDDVLEASEMLLQSGSVSLRAGWDRLLSQAFSKVAEQENRGLRVTILSVNWSETFIRASLKAASRHSDCEERLGRGIDELSIAANEIEGLRREAGSSGMLSDPKHTVIRTNLDKMQNYKRDDSCFDIYVGDSSTDFDCLLAADLGICIRDTPMSSSAKGLADVFGRLGYEAPHVDSLGSWNDLASAESGVFWAKDFNEIMDLLERLQI